MNENLISSSEPLRCGGRGGGIEGAAEGSGHPGSNQSLPLIGLVACQALTNCVPSRVVVMASAAREFPREKNALCPCFQAKLLLLLSRGETPMEFFNSLDLCHVSILLRAHRRCSARESNSWKVTERSARQLYAKTSLPFLLYPLFLIG